MEFNHIPVMLNECIENLSIKDDGIYVDGTLGGAGHSLEIVKKLSPKGKLIGIDKDTNAIDFAKQKLENYKNVIFVNDNHDNIKEILQKINVDEIDGILLDLGVSSYQIDEAKRGFSYMKEAPLDMRMDLSQSLDAKEIVNTYSEKKLSEIIYKYGEERFANSIAKNICIYRKDKPIETTIELAKIIEKSIPAFAKKDGHPAKKTFQAIRIEVNAEIEPLYNTIKDYISVLKSKGRLCVISFHSLEDRAVKLAFSDLVGKCTCPSDLPYCICNNKSVGKVITKKPILPSKEEMEVNSRSRSAKLRVFEKY
ncbi:MAG: 16S rRNA (cytosine(1402)-N(4))-methyltransferase RsmH [Lachnospiraceae bacterium]|nr:16S rRNA (cytosine(1402)-N(4))-methyltransferase RsmH [Lachnospiraceae bacterium]